MKLTKIIVTLSLIYTIVMLTACPAASLQKAESASKRIATYANAGVNVTRTLFESKVISIGQKDEVARKFIVLAEGGIAFDIAIGKAKQLYGTNVPKSELVKIFAIFDTELVERFLDVLQSLRIIANKAAFAAVIDTIRASVLIIANVFGQRHLIETKIRAAI